MGRVLVVDASVAVKWLLPEKHSVEATALLARGNRLIAPDLLWIEVGNVLWKHQRRGSLSIEETTQLAEQVMSIPIEIEPSESLVQPAVQLALSTGRSVYDCVYIALALMRDAVLATADERLAHALAGGELGARVRWIGTVGS
ncbi:MAG: type II toxin-antitoxin system VapC family toxin [Phycisphaerales bacterium]|jgi:predicted nucleic acid-binding protein